MSDDVKSEPTRRQRKAIETRRRVLDSAERLFAGEGYVATTIAAIADDADVAVQTVYAIFGTKRAILTELLAARTVGDDLAGPLAARADWQAMEQEPNAEQQLAMLAAIATKIGARMAGLYEVMAGAAGSDPEIADLLKKQQLVRYRDQRRVARVLARRGQLRRELAEVRAADIIWAIANPRMYHTLVDDRGWTPDEYEQWLAKTLQNALLSNEGDERAMSGP